jgi:hypothetical protein
MKRIPPGVSVQSFPTFIVEDENGAETNRIVGSQSDAKSLMTQLGLKAKKRRRTLRGRRAGTTRRKVR